MAVYHLSSNKKPYLCKCQGPCRKKKFSSLSEARRAAGGFQGAPKGYSTVPKPLRKGETVPKPMRKRDALPNGNRVSPTADLNANFKEFKERGGKRITSDQERRMEVYAHKIAREQEDKDFASHHAQPARKKSNVTKQKSKNDGSRLKNITSRIASLFKL